MLELNRQRTRRNPATLRGGGALRRFDLVLALALLFSVGHAAIVASAAEADVKAVSPTSLVAHESRPGNAGDCVVELKVVPPPTVKPGLAWAGPAVASAIAFPALDAPAVWPPNAHAACSAGERRALLQVFLI